MYLLLVSNIVVNVRQFHYNTQMHRCTTDLSFVFSVSCRKCCHDNYRCTPKRSKWTLSFPFCHTTLWKQLVISSDAIPLHERYKEFSLKSVHCHSAVPLAGHSTARFQEIVENMLHMKDWTLIALTNCIELYPNKTHVPIQQHNIESMKTFASCGQSFRSKQVHDLSVSTILLSADRWQIMTLQRTGAAL